MKNLYESIDGFMIRTPILSLDEYNKYFIKNEEDEVLKSKKVIEESILIASKSLYNAMTEKTGEVTDKAKESFDKYYNRMTTRSTPYGLFAGVNMGEFGEVTNVKMNSKTDNIKFVYPDMQWIMSVVKLLEKDKNILRNLKVTTASALYVNGNKIYNLYYTYGGSKDSSEKSDYSNLSINYTGVVQYILELGKKPILIQDIIDNLAAQLPQINLDIIENLVFQLVDKEYLVTEFKLSPLEKDSLDFLITRLEDMGSDNQYLILLKDVSDKIKKYEECKIGEGIQTYLELEKLMSSICRADNYIQIDMKTNYKRCVLSTKIKEKIEDFSEFLSKFSLIPSRDIFEEYKGEFIEKYGTDRFVPLMEVLDPDKGIGVPDLNQNPSFENKEFYRLKRILLEKYNDVMCNGETEISLSMDDVEKSGISGEVDINKLPVSFDWGGIISTSSSESIEKDDYKIFVAPVIGAASAGRVLGRFYNCYSQKDLEMIKSINNREKEVINENVKIAELQGIFKIGRLLNVSRTLKMRDIQIPLGTWCSDSENKLNLTDIHIGLSNNEFILWSCKENCRIIVNKTNMLNSMLPGCIYQFLISICENRSWFNLYSILDKVFDKYIYIPRITYKNVVVKSATWNLCSYMLNIDKNVKFQEGRLYLEKWIKKYNVPDKVYYVEGDNRILINLKDVNKLKYIFNELRKRKEVILKEVEVDLDNNFIKNSEDNSYFGEFIFSIIRTKKNKPVKRKVTPGMFKYSTYGEERTFLPTDKWVYLSLYGGKVRQNQLLSKDIYEFIKTLKDNDFIEKSFFIRYALNNRHHIRLRIEKKNEAQSLNKYINRFLLNVKEKGLISNVTIETYERELERYGGNFVYDYVERYFETDSIAVMMLLREISNKNINFDKKLIGVISIIKLMEDFSIEYEEQLKIFDSIIQVSEFREEYKSYKSQMVKLCNSSYNWKDLRQEEKGEELINILSVRSEALKNLRMKINEAESKSELTNDIRGILLSIIHMFCNRFYGTNRMLEREVMAYTRHTLYALKYFKRNEKY